MFPIHPELMNVLERLPRKGRYVLWPAWRAAKTRHRPRLLIRDVINPLKENFPSPAGEQGFADGRLHGFRIIFVPRAATGACQSVC
jgi:hypothetical protein